MKAAASLGFMGLLLSACGDGRSPERRKIDDSWMDELAGYSLSSPNIKPNGDWVISSRTLDAPLAETEAKAQVAAGNCRLIVTRQYSYRLVGREPGFNWPQAKYGLIIIGDTADVVTPAVREAQDRAEAYGQIYNRVVRESCDFTVATSASS